MAPSRKRPTTRVTRYTADDHISEAKPSQQEDEDAVDEEVRKVGLTKKSSSAKQMNGNRTKMSQEDEKDAVEADDDRIDVDNFPDQPLARAELAKLEGLSKDWSMIRKNIHQHSFSLVKDIAVSMADAAEGNEADKALPEIERVMKELIDIEQEMLAHEQTLNDIHQRVARAEDINDAAHRYNDGVRETLVAYRKKTSRQKYAKNEEFTLFMQGIYEAQHPGEPMPPVTEFIDKEDGDDSDEDDDLEVGGVTQDYNCLLSLTPLVNPVTSPECGHSFSAEVIREYFGNVRAPKKCPAVGCNKSFTFTTLQPNKDLAKRAKAAARRAQMREDDSDGEVIE